MKETPMGISQWEEYGRKYGYWNFFKLKHINTIMNILEGKRPVFIDFTCDDCEKEADSRYQFTCTKCKKSFKSEHYKKNNKDLWVYEEVFSEDYFNKQELSKKKEKLIEKEDLKKWKKKQIEEILKS